MEPNTNYAILQNRNVRMGAGLVVLIVALAIGLPHLFKHTPYSYKYHKLSSVSYKGVPGTGINLQAPAQLTKVSSQVPSYSSFQQSLTSNKQTKIVAGVITTSAKLPASDLTAEAKIVKDALARTSASSTNPPVAVGLLKLLGIWLPKGTTAQITGSQLLKNQYITDNAWVLNLSITSSSNSIAMPMKGDYLYALGKNGEYITLLYDHNWDTNSSVWQKAIDSYQIDQ